MPQGGFEVDRDVPLLANTEEPIQNKQNQQDRIPGSVKVLYVVYTVVGLSMGIFLPSLYHFVIASKTTLWTTALMTAN